MSNPLSLPLPVAPLGEALDLEPIKSARKALLANPPIRWGRGDVVPLIERDIPLLIAEVERLRLELQESRDLYEANHG